MNTIGVYEAKSKLSELLERAASGESFLITRHGHPVARLVPDTAFDPAERRKAVEELKSLRGSAKNATINDFVDARREGHRF